LNGLKKAFEDAEKQNPGISDAFIGEIVQKLGGLGKLQQ
jgi:hypothetical protein